MLKEKEKTPEALLGSMVQMSRKKTRKKKNKTSWSLKRFSKLGPKLLRTLSRTLEYIWKNILSLLNCKFAPDSPMRMGGLVIARQQLFMFEFVSRLFRSKLHLGSLGYVCYVKSFLASHISPIKHSKVKSWLWRLWRLWTTGPLAYFRLFPRSCHLTFLRGRKIGSQRFRGGIHTSGVAGDCTSQAAKRWKKHQRFSQGTAEALEKAFAKITESLDIVLMCRFPEKKTRQAQCQVKAIWK